MTPFEQLLVRTILPQLSGPPAAQTASAEQAAKRIIIAMKEARIVTINCDDIVGYVNQYSWTYAELSGQGQTEADYTRTAVVRFTDRFRAYLLQNNMVRITRDETPDGIRLIMRADLLLPGYAAKHKASEPAQ